jgi:hypothetical protein
MCIVPLPAASMPLAAPELQSAAASAAAQLSHQQRLRIALDVLAGQDICQLAQQHQVRTMPEKEKN